MSELLTENRRIHLQIEKLTDENMNFAAVIRTLRQHLREDNAKLEKVERERDEAMAKYAAEATDHMLAVNKLCNERDEAREIAAVFKDYAQLLGDEINEMAVFASVHGWKSSRIEQGKVLREKIKQLESEK